MPDQARGQLKQGPQRVNAADCGVGRYIPDLTFTDLSGKSQRLSEIRDRQAIVLAMTSTSCPLSKKYLPGLAQLAKTYAPRGVAFLAVNPIAADKPADMQKAQAALGDKALYVFDRDELLASAVGARSTTDVIVLDPSRTIVYHGAIDDQYGIGYALEAPKQPLLADALDALLAGRRPAVAATSAPGCTLDLEPAATPSAGVTYHNRISRIVQQHCVECHRDGGVAPFALANYQDMAAHAAMIRQVVERGVMPPWFAAPPEQGHISPWSNDRSLAHSEKADLLAWISGGKPEGDPRDAPQPRTFADGWLIGKPDAVFEFERPVPVKATGTMPYQNVALATNLPEDKWVQAIEIRPGARDVVHHVLVFARSGDAEESRSHEVDADERMGYWGIYVPGTSTLVYPEGYAKRLPKGATFRFQMHYTPNGTATEDRTQIGLVFAKQPPRHEVRVAGVVNSRLTIPPGEENHREVATLRIPADVEVLAFLPHMHLRGKAARYEVTGKDGQAQLLLDIPRYDFNWQLLYRYAEPLSLKAGDTLTFTSWFDNSDKNPANPDPSKTVRWGPQTYDEMQLGYVEYIVPGAAAGSGDRPRGIPALTRESLLNLIDTDGDGAISKQEFTQRAQNNSRFKDNPQLVEVIFKSLDADSDGKLEAAELDKLRELILKRQ
jgi:thiol-disulfide isomerase/thioredoxin/mono/diheme cytochrome c family protein